MKKTVTVYYFLFDYLEYPLANTLWLVCFFWCPDVVGLFKMNGLVRRGYGLWPPTWFLKDSTTNPEIKKNYRSSNKYHAHPI